jgi:quinol monooxygenase YgiN
MSGRRRRDDGWDDGRLDAQDDRRDPWADDSIGEWGGADADPGDEADRSAKSAGSAAGAYARNVPPGGQAYAAPDFPSFQAGGGSPGDDRYGSNSGYGGQRADGYRDAGYGGSRDGYQGSGYGASANGASRRDAAGYDAAYGGGDSANGYGRSANGASARGNDPGYGNGSGYGSGSGYGGANGRSAGAGYAPEFTPIDNDEVDDDGPADTPRPYGRLSIYTLHDDKTREFDRLAERAAEGVRTSEPDTLVYVIHVVPKAPMQRIIYEIYRDRAAFVSHERQPHIRQFAADRASCVLATNIIDLRLKYAKVAALGPSPEATGRGQAQQPAWNARAAEPAPSGDRYSAAPQYSTTQYSSPQYSPAPTQVGYGAAAAAASFTPAKESYGADNAQYPTVGREAYPASAAPQYGNSGNGAYAAGNSQYGAANSNGYSGAAGYANGGSYSASAYPGSNGYQGANGYSGDNGYSGANGYQSANGYSGANGYSNGSGYSPGNGYSNGSYSTANGYSNAGGYSNGSANGAGNGNANGAAGGYGAAAGYGDGAAGSYGASNGAQYTPRYRELTSGAESDASPGGYPDNGQHYADETRQSARPQPAEWDPRTQGYR